VSANTAWVDPPAMMPMVAVHADIREAGGSGATAVFERRAEPRVARVRSPPALRPYGSNWFVSA
jgi:hypothetical protein